MRGVLCLLCFVALLCGGGLVSTAMASPEDAAELYRKAEAKYKIQNYREALEDFQRSYELSKEPAILFNIGQCYRQLGQLEDARKSFSFFVHDASDHPKRSSAEKLIEEIDAKLKELSGNGSIQVSSKQRAAEIFIDGISRGKPPVLLEDVSPGEHLITAKQAGFADYELNIVVKASQRVELNIPQLVPLSGEAPKPSIPTKPFFLGAAGLGAVGAGSLAASVGFFLQSKKRADFTLQDIDTGGGPNGEPDGEASRDELIDRANFIDQSQNRFVSFGVTAIVCAGLAATSAITGAILQQKNKDKTQEAK